MTAYAIAHLRPRQINAEVLDYMERVQGTLDPFGGRFLVHGAVPEAMEGPFEGTVVVVAFPGIDEARGWYASPAYQEILPLRTRHLDGEAILVEGVPADYDPASTADRLRAAAGL
ncbi:DUF1330 domain-containing protein [Streptomyces sp. 12297]